MARADPYLVPRLAGPLDLAVRPPGSKSITCRAYVLAALARGPSRIARPLRSADTDALLEALVALGARAEREGDDLLVEGVGGRFPRGGEVHLGDGGTPSRFMLAAACLAAEPVRVDGSPQMRRRPVGEGVDLLRALGADLAYLEERGHLPVLVTPSASFRGGGLDVPTTLSSQFISALLLVGPWLPGGLALRYTGPVTSASYVDLTVHVLLAFGVDVARTARGVTVAAGPVAGDRFPVEADASSAAYWAAAAALSPGGSARIAGLPADSPQADTGAIDVLGDMGATVAPCASGVRVTGGPALRGVEADCASFPDGAVALGAVAAGATGITTLRGLRTLRYKESDRIAALETELRRLGCAVRSTDDALTIDPSPRHGEPVVIRTYDDHRLAMAFAVLGLARGGIAVENPDCVSKSYPDFWADLERAAGTR